MKRILVFKHMSSQNPGTFRDIAADFGVEFHEIDLHAGDIIPKLSEFDGLWAMGGSMNVWDEDQFPWLALEKATIRQAVCEMKMPFLGICFGHQLLAEALGGKVQPAIEHELGLVPITPTEQGRGHALLSGLPTSDDWPEWPGWVNVHLVEVQQAPAEAVILARSDGCANHIMAVGEHAFSCQFHPEVCSHTVSEWLKIPGIPELLVELLGKQGCQEFQADIARHLAAHNAAAAQLFKNWMELVY